MRRTNVAAEAAGAVEIADVGAGSPAVARIAPFPIDFRSDNDRSFACARRRRLHTTFSDESRFPRKPETHFNSLHRSQSVSRSFFRNDASGFGEIHSTEDGLTLDIVDLRLSRKKIACCYKAELEENSMES